MNLDDWLAGWGYAMQSFARLGSVTMLSALTSRMVWGLLGYQVYLVYAGTMTNETMKWSDWKLDVQDGYAFKRQLPPGDPWSRQRHQSDYLQSASNGGAKDLCTRWPLEPAEILVRTEDGSPPAPDGRIPGLGEWQPVYDLSDVDNLYDLGLWHNLCDVFIKDYAFGADKQSLPSLAVRIPPGRRWRSGRRGGWRSR